MQRSIPDPEGSTTLEWEVEAILDDQNVVAGYAEFGTFNFSALINPCPLFLDQRTRLIVDEFPTVE